MSLISKRSKATKRPGAQPALGRPLYQDAQFYCALVLGPLVWAGLYYLRMPPWLPWWPMQNPELFLRWVLIYPVLEELAFRGWLQGWCLQRTWGGQRWWCISQANLLTSLAFALAHAAYHPWAWAMLVFFPALIFGYFRERYASTKPAIILHVFYNGGFFWLFAPGE